MLNLYLEPKLIVNDHREPEHFVSDKNKCTAIYLCPCVFFELFRRDLNEAKAVSCNVVNYLLSSVNISYLPLCNYMTLRLCLKFQVMSLTITLIRGDILRFHNSRALIEKRDKGWNFTRAFVWSVTTLDWTSPRGFSHGYVRGNTKRWTAAFDYNFCVNTSSTVRGIYM